MATEDVSARFQDLDAWGDLDILKALYEGQLAAVAAIATSLPAIAEAVAAAVPRLEAGGRLIYAGAAIIHPRIFAGATAAPASLNRYFDEAISAGRLHGMRMQGSWITVGTPDAIAPAEAVVKRALAGAK